MRLCVFIVFIALPAFAPQAQTFGEVEDRQTNVAAYFYHVLPGEATRQVYVWGTVEHPGLYVVSDQTDLGELLSLAGGPKLAPLDNNDRREVDVRLFNTEGGQRTLAYESPLEEMLTAPGQYPPLREGDILEVDMREIKAFDWRDLVTIVGAAAAVALATERIISSGGG